MDPTPLYDLRPVLAIAVVGLLLAAGPLAWIWRRHRAGVPGQRRRALTVLTLFLTFDLVLFGAFTRLSDSGLGCPDWPGCYGNASPLGAHAEIRAAEAVHPTGVVTFGKAWVEMVHRYLATGVGMLIIAMTVAAWIGWRRRAAADAPGVSAAAAGAPVVSPLWATATLVWVCLQGAFGALTVTMKLYPAIVVLHLLGGLGLLALLAAQAQLQAPRPLALGAGLRRASAAVALLVVVQIALGGWVSTNYAVLACTDFPTCHGQWWPPMDFEHGFALARELGTGKDGGALPFEALTAIHVTHRAFALIVFAGLLGLAWRLWRLGRAGGDPAAPRDAAVLVGLALWQAASGIGNVVLGWPIAAALAHTGGAAALVFAMTSLLVRAGQAASGATVAGGTASPQAASGRQPASRLHHV